MTAEERVDPEPGIRREGHTAPRECASGPKHELRLPPDSERKQTTSLRMQIFR